MLTSSVARLRSRGVFPVHGTFAPNGPIDPLSRAPNLMIGRVWPGVLLGLSSFGRAVHAMTWHAWLKTDLSRSVAGDRSLRALERPVALGLALSWRVVRLPPRLVWRPVGGRTASFLRDWSVVSDLSYPLVAPPSGGAVGAV